MEIWLLYGRRIIDACFATIFAEQSTLSLNRSITIGLCSIIQDQFAAAIDSIAASFFVLLGNVILERMIDTVITRHSTDLSCPCSTVCCSIQTGVLHITSLSMRNKSASHTPRHGGFVLHLIIVLARKSSIF